MQRTAAGNEWRVNDLSFGGFAFIQWNNAASANTFQPVVGLCSIFCRSSSPSIIWISCNVFPFVSGTVKITKNIPMTQNPAKIQNAGPFPKAEFSDPNDDVTENTSIQLNAPAIEATTPFISFATNSPIIIHGTGPKPNENRAMNTQIATSGMKSKVESISSSALKYTPSTVIQTPIVAIDDSKSQRRPTRSTVNDDRNTAITCITPTMMVNWGLPMLALPFSKISPL